MKFRKTGPQAERKLIALLLILMLVPLAAPAESGAGGAEVKLESKTYPCLIYTGEGDGKFTESEMTLYFINGTDIPYIALSEYMPFLSSLMKQKQEWDVTYEVRKDSDKAFTVTRHDNGSSLTINTETDVMYFDDFNLFTNDPDSSALVTVMSLPDPEELDYMAIYQKITEAAAAGHPLSEEEQKALKRGHDPAADHSLFAATGRIFNRNGNPVRLVLSDYSIDLVSDGNECYVPFQTLNDLFASLMYLQIVVTGKRVIVDEYRGSVLGKMYEEDPCAISPELAEFSYNELCMLMDQFYGLKGEHRISRFSDFIATDARLHDYLSSTDPQDIDHGMIILLLSYMDDGHSAITQSSWRSGNNSVQFQVQFGTELGPNTLQVVSGARSKGLKAARSAAYPDGVPGYEEIGDTAFVTFDSFTAERSDRSEYYNLELNDWTDAKDTIELILYAHKMVTRPDSPIKNIVIDLSLNGGGNADAAVAVACWFTGTASISLLDTMTGAETVMSYRTDLNLNGVALDDPGDTVSGGAYNLYCLTSRNSFSCGNLIPAVFEQSGFVTLIGRRSGGGSCVVMACTSASGSVFQISGSKELSTTRNGTFYSIDAGIPVDIPLTKDASFYDRAGLVELIHNTR